MSNQQRKKRKVENFSGLLSKTLLSLQGMIILLGVEINIIKNIRSWNEINLFFCLIKIDDVLTTIDLHF
jgi:hypothetical protein